MLLHSRPPGYVCTVSPFSSVTLTNSQASAMYGYDSAFIGGTLELPAFQTAFGLSPEAVTELSSHIVSTFQGGAFFGAILGTFCSEKFGRRWSIVGSGVCFIIGVILQMFGNLGMLYGGRVFTGAGVGASTVIIPIYISECSPAAIRGRLIGVFEIMLQTALVCGFWVNYGVQQNIPDTDSSQWRIPVGVQFIPSAILVIAMPFAIESPRWLVSVGREPDALKALSWVRNLPPTHSYIEREIGDIRQQVNHEIELTGGKTSAFQAFGELRNSSIRNRVLTAMMLMLLQNLTG